jgi:acyl-[acyl-carrier-protein]-phospholipid O-acyltransferase / long-chain-fatty-acid--[acyl-carrier-protein] ligase
VNEIETPGPSPRIPASTKGFWALIVTQFQGAFSDNVVKNLVILIALFGASMTAVEKNHFGESIGALFSLPFILFSMGGGFLADRFSKRSVMLGVKIFELLIMSLVLAGLWTLNKHVLLASVFLMGTHSAFFGPSKYGSLPELLPERKLSWGNGILELGTFMAIILGTVAAAFLAQHLRGEQWVSGLILIGLAVLGFFACLQITRIPAANPQKKFNANFPAEVWRQLRAMRGDRPLWLAVIGNTYFNFLGALMLLNLFFYGADVLHVDETKIGLLNVALAVGIGVGSVAAGYLSGGKIEYGLVPLGAFGLSIFSALLALPQLSVTHALVLLALLGLAGGFFIVPIAALLQHRPARDNKGQVQATANLLSFVGVFLASGAHWLLAQQFQLSPGHIFLVGGLLTFAGAIYVLFLLPDALLRFMLWLVTRTLYRIRVDGRDNIPAKGGALFVCNHVSWMDALLLIASTDRNVRFVMFKDIYDQKWINPFCRILGVIPVSSYQRPRELIKSLQAASAAIRNGEVVCIFAEGEITRIGQLLPFRRGFERIMKDVDAPIIPIALDGVLGSPSSFKHGKFVWRLPSRVPHPVTVSFGAPLPANATAFTVRQAVQELQADAWSHRRKHMKTLPRLFVRTARRHPRRFAMADAQTPGITFGDALVRTVFLAQRLKKIWTGQKMVGLLLPPSVPGALVNYAALLCGKVPVNLNYTLSAEALASCAKQCDLKTVLTSRAFLEKVKLTVPGEVIYLEDMVVAPGALEKFTAFLMAKFLPAGLLQRALASNRKSAIGNRKSLDDLATVIFSSGSTGEPKGVMLSHYNIVSNAEQLEQMFGLGKADRLLGVLPFFHSFGFTGTLAIPAATGVGVAFHANPLDLKTIGPLVRQHAVTFLLATPTFLQLYLRGCAPGDLGSVRLVMTGAEKLPERLATAFEEKFGIRPLEAYGCTECSPAVTVNAHDFRAAGFRQVGAKRGTIGHPLPGVCVRIVDVNNPRSETPLPLGEPGLLLVRGPNVMVGYLGRPEKTAEVLIRVAAGVSPAVKPGVPPGGKDVADETLVDNLKVAAHPIASPGGRMPPSTSGGTPDATQLWYLTGDVALVDEDGFVQITDRLSRFSKIGGEMVPHIKIEERLHELAGVTEQTFVVTGVPDEKKGERLVVLHRLKENDLAAVLEKFAACDLPNLWKPKADAFHRVEQFPLLGTGKLDLRGVKEMAIKSVA